MILVITVGDNDFTEELEQFASDIEGTAYVMKAARLDNPNLSQEDKLALFKRMDHFRELFYNTDKYTPELATELCEMVRQNWEIFVNNTMCDHDYWDEDDAKRIRECLIRDFKVKFQKSLTPKWHNGEIVCVCCGYPNRWWTF